MVTMVAKTVRSGTISLYLYSLQMSSSQASNSSYKNLIYIDFTNLCGFFDSIFFKTKPSRSIRIIKRTLAIISNIKISCFDDFMIYDATVNTAFKIYFYDAVIATFFFYPKFLWWYVYWLQEASSWTRHWQWISRESGIYNIYTHSFTWVKRFYNHAYNLVRDE